jgi:nuclear mRNA export protein PCID2/THP1
MCGVEMDLDECECVLANLIYRKYVKGYISHKARTLVLSKQQPFPPLNSITFDDQQA